MGLPSGGRYAPPGQVTHEVASVDTDIPLAAGSVARTRSSSHARLARQPVQVVHLVDGSVQIPSLVVVTGASARGGFDGGAVERRVSNGQGVRVVGDARVDHFELLDNVLDGSVEENNWTVGEGLHLPLRLYEGLAMGDVSIGDVVGKHLGDTSGNVSHVRVLDEASAACGHFKLP